MVYALYFILLTFGGIVARKREESNVYLFVIMTLLLAIIGLRDASVGFDTLSYIEDYRNIARLSFSEMLDCAFKSTEPLYVIVSWLPSILSLNYTMYLILWALFPVMSLYKVFKRELKDGTDYFIAIMVFFLLGLFAFYIAGIRQTAALSVILVGSKFLTDISWRGIRSLFFDKNIYLFLFTVGIAFMFHNSSIIFILAIPCLLFKVRWWYLLLVVCVFFIGRVIQIDQIVVLSKFLFDDRFANYGTTYESSQSISALIMQVILFLICFFVKGKLTQQSSQNNFLFNLMFLGIVFQSLSGMMAEMARVSFYFSMYAMILVPRALKLYPVNFKMIIYIGFVTFSLFYLFYLSGSNLPPYNSVL